MKVKCKQKLTMGTKQLSYLIRKNILEIFSITIKHMSMYFVFESNTTALKNIQLYFTKSFLYALDQHNKHKTNSVYVPYGFKNSKIGLSCRNEIFSFVI